MTVQELYDAVTELGFDDRQESLSRFCAMANVALYTANGIAPKMRNIFITQNKNSPVSEEAPQSGKAKENAYELTSMDEDFLRFSPNPVSLNGTFLTEGKDYRIQDHSTLCIPASAQGSFSVFYYVKLRPIRMEDPAEMVDLPEDLARLLPLLVASYVWLDDEEEKAAVYRNMFFRSAEALQIPSHPLASSQAYDFSAHWGE